MSRLVRLMLTTVKIALGCLVLPTVAVATPSSPVATHAHDAPTHDAPDAHAVPDRVLPIVTTTNICPACQVFLRNEGATITGPRSAKW